MKKATTGEKMQIKAIRVEGYDSPEYLKLLTYTPANNRERWFKDLFKCVRRQNMKPFLVPVCDPSYSEEDGKFQFVRGAIPATGHSYRELRNYAKEQKLQIGTRNQYIMFLGALILRLIDAGWTEKDAWNAVCTNSTMLGHYLDSDDSKAYFELTGSREIVGKYDLGNACKILKVSKNYGGFWVAGGWRGVNGDFSPLAHFEFNANYDRYLNNAVPWFVFPAK